MLETTRREAKGKNAPEKGSTVTGGEQISGGLLLAKALKNEGVDVIFTLTGGEIVDIFKGCVEEGIRIVDVRHEQAAAHAADGYARMTGKTGCAVVTAGPGTTDAYTGVANAFYDQSPFLLIGGLEPLKERLRGALGDLPHTRIMEPVTKFSATVPGTERIAELVSMAFRECHSGAPGPSYLEIPVDVLRHSVDPAQAPIPAPGRYRASTRSLGDPRDIASLAAILAKAERPCALFDSQLMTCRANDIAAEFCHTLNIPAYTSGAARGTFPPDDPLYFHHTRHEALNSADVILVVGMPLDYRMGYGRSLGHDATVVQIDLDYRTVGKNHDFTLGIVGDVGVVMSAVLEHLKNVKDNGARARENWVETLRQAEQKAFEATLPHLRSDQKPIHPLRLAYEIDQFLKDDSIFIGDGGDVVTFSGGIVRPKAPGQWMDTGPLGCLGVGTPFAMAAKLAYPEKRSSACTATGASR
jgi:Thiamine pyrophosphate-requiring enzymes [acetolactate synthase, pyruvate dehydrogenase (cytochrome), glyoxylate carboligase, phosphonopyruvate decarboxylase]